ncbi:hypothetical protein QTP88_019374 [Uroleucon formosanum]
MIFLKKEFLKKILSGESCQDESRSVSSFEKFKLNSFNILDSILNSIEKRFVSNENLLRDCKWLDPKSFSSIESMKHSDALQTICELAGVDRQVICLELKQFASQFQNFLPDLSSSDLNYKNNTNTQTESSNDTESEDEKIEWPCRWTTDSRDQNYLSTYLPYVYLTQLDTLFNTYMGQNFNNFAKSTERY